MNAIKGFDLSDKGPVTGEFLFEFGANGKAWLQGGLGRLVVTPVSQQPFKVVTLKNGQLFEWNSN